MTKVILNKCHGGFSLSDEARQIVCQDGCGNCEDCHFCQKLADAILERGSEIISGKYACLAVEEFDEREETAQIGEYDGKEWLETTPVIREEELKKYFIQGFYSPWDYLDEKGVNLAED